MGGAVAGVAAASARAERRVISHFLSANAVSADNAVPFTADHRLEERFFDRLRDKDVIRPGKNGGYYIDAPAYDEYQQGRRRVRGLALAAGALAMGAGIAFGLIA